MTTSFLLYREILFLRTNSSLPLLTISFSVFLSLFYFWLTSESQPAEITISMLFLFSLFSIFLTTDQLFKEEIDQGCLESFLLQKIPFSYLIFYRYLTYYLIVIAPLSVINGSILCILLKNSDFLFFIIIFLIFFIPYSLIALVAALFTHGAEKQKSLAFLICLPFFIPFILTQQFFLSTWAQGGNINEPLRLLGGLLLFFVPLNYVSLIYGLKFAIRMK